MPISKARMRERKRLERKLKKESVNPEPSVNRIDALDSLRNLISNIESGVKPEKEIPDYEIYRRGRKYPVGTKLMNPATGEIFEMPEVDIDGNPIDSF